MDVMGKALSADWIVSNATSTPNADPDPVMQRVCSGLGCMGNARVSIRVGCLWVVQTAKVDQWLTAYGTEIALGLGLGLGRVLGPCAFQRHSQMNSMLLIDQGLARLDEVDVSDEGDS